MLLTKPVASLLQHCCDPAGPVVNATDERNWLCRETTPEQYLAGFYPGFVDLADVILVAEGVRFPAHSQVLSMHSRFIQQLILDTGPVSWQNPLVLDTVLIGYTSDAVSMMLAGSYKQGLLAINSIQDAWQLCRLVDKVDCPRMLQQCTEYLGNSIDAAVLKTPGEALDWILTADKLRLNELKEQCAKKIATDFVMIESDLLFRQLPAELLLMIMSQMSLITQDLKGQLNRRGARGRNTLPF